MSKTRGMLAVLAIVPALASACGSDDSEGGATPTCASNPQSCPAGQTCWVVDQSLKYACIDAPADKVQGTPCVLSPGLAPCGPGLYCISLDPNSSQGFCSPFCQNLACPGGAQCVQYTVFAPGVTAEPINVCTPSVGADAGADAPADAPADAATD